MFRQFMIPIGVTSILSNLRSIRLPLTALRLLAGLLFTPIDSELIGKRFRFRSAPIDFIVA